MTSIHLLHRLATGWDKRARVRSLNDLEINFDKTKDDFLVELLPFYEHPLFQDASPELKSNILSCGWLVYNARTIAIETDIVHPVCLAILSAKIKGKFDFLSKQLVTETLVDESYHIHLCVYANEITKHHRKIEIELPTFELIKKMHTLQNDCEENWKKLIIQLVTAISSEIYITDYLALISKEKNNALQPLNSLLVKTHRSDELAHGKIFHHIAKIVFNALDEKQKEFFAETMSKPISWLSDLEFDLWLSILRQINFDHAEQMINECKNNRNSNTNPYQLNEGTSDLIALAEELGVLDMAIGREAFIEAKLL